jgi:serine/threonine protein phosphatase PrpC
VLTCPACGGATTPHDPACAACGRAVPDPAPPAAVAAAPAVGTAPAAAPTAPAARPGTGTGSGTCAACRTRPPEDRCPRCRPGGPAPRDHVEADLAAAAGVSDRGLRHARNEDAMAVRDPADGVPDVLAVVCDGVSTSPRPDEASAAAAAAGAAALADGLASGADPRRATADALARARAAVAALADGTGPPAPACTFVSAVVPPDGADVTLGWIGDSRAYWLAGAPTATPSALLTRDDSWGEAMVSLDVMTPEQARRSPHAHALTAWLGADAGDHDGHVAQVAVRGPGTLLVCSDGLWNYLPDAADLAAAARPAGADPLAIARTLVRYALDAGGGDNVTVVAVPVAAPPGEGAP